MASLVKSALPKSRSGRKSTPLDGELADALITALRDAPTEKVDGEDRPAAYGPDVAYETEGKATSQGRRYANAAADALKTTVRVNAYSPNGNEKGPFRWRCYIPLSVSNAEKKNAAKK